MRHVRKYRLVAADEHVPPPLDSEPADDNVQADDSKASDSASDHSESDPSERQISDEDILICIPKPFKHRTRALLYYMRGNVSYDKTGKLPNQEGHIVDLIKYAVGSYKRLPIGYREFTQSLKNCHVPLSLYTQVGAGEPSIPTNKIPPPGKPVKVVKTKWLKL